MFVGEYSYQRRRLVDLVIGQVGVRARPFQDLVIDRFQKFEQQEMELGRIFATNRFQCDFAPRARGSEVVGHVSAEAFWSGSGDTINSSRRGRWHRS